MLIGVLNNYCDEELMRYRANIKLLFYIRRYEQYIEEKNSFCIYSQFERKEFEYR